MGVASATSAVSLEYHLGAESLRAEHSKMVYPTHVEGRE
jgi:hypothetical protein